MRWAYSSLLTVRRLQHYLDRKRPTEGLLVWCHNQRLLPPGQSLFSSVPRPTFTRPSNKAYTNESCVQTQCACHCPSVCTFNSAEQYSTNSMEQGPRNQHLLSEPRNSPRFVETERSSLFEKIRHRYSIIRHIQPVHHNINFNSILSCVPRSSKWPICPSRFATKSLYAFLYFTMRATCPASLNRFDFTI